MKGSAIIFCLLALVSCSDGEMAKMAVYGKSRSIKCYSGSKLIYRGHSTGKIQSESNSDGYFFVERGTNKLMEVSGNCVIGE